MARLIWAVLCHKDLIDQSSKQISLIDVLEKITLNQKNLEHQAEISGSDIDKMMAEGFVFPIPMRLVPFWTRSDPDKPEEFEMRILLHSPTGEELAKQVVPVSLARHRNSRPSIRFSFIRFAGVGIYQVVIQKRDGGKGRFVRQAEIPLEIVLEEGDPAIGRAE